MPCPTRFGAALIAAFMLTGPVEAAQIGLCGGDGGSQSKTLSCPSGQYIVGLFVRRGAYVDRIGVRCAKIDSAGKRGTPGAFQYAGGSGGSFSKSATCPGDRAVTLMFTKTGSYVDNVLFAVCQPRQAQGAFHAEEPLKAINVTTGATGGGYACELRCPVSEAMHKLIVRYGGWVDSIEGFCRP